MLSSSIFRADRLPLLFLVALLTGVAPLASADRFTPLPNTLGTDSGAVRDNTTGLIWLQDASCDELPNINNEVGASWALADNRVQNLGNGLCGLSDDSSPGDWRLPTSAEWAQFTLAARNAACLPTVSDTAGTGCWVDGNPFDGVKTASYWTSEFVNVILNIANSFDLATGLGAQSSGNLLLHVWPVRQGPPVTDLDGDTVPDDEDNCPNVANLDQSDIDDDGVGDLCDSDADGDGVSNDDELAIGTNPFDPPPEALALIQQLTNIGGTASVNLDGSGSMDSLTATADLAFDWLVDGAPFGSGQSLDIDLPYGTFDITLVVTDEDGESDSDSQTITVDPASLAALETRKAKVRFRDDRSEVTVVGEIGLPVGVDFSELSPFAVVNVDLANTALVDAQSLMLTQRGNNGQKWQYRDNNVTTGITKFTLDWDGAEFRYRDRDLKLRLQSESLAADETVLSLKYNTSKFDGAFTLDIAGLASVQIGSTGDVIGSDGVTVEVIKNRREVQLTLDFALLQSMDINFIGSIDQSVSVGDFYSLSVGRFRLEVAFDESQFPAGSATQPRELGVDFLIGTEGYAGSIDRLDEETLQVEGNKWVSNAL